MAEQLPAAAAAVALCLGASSWSLHATTLLVCSLFYDEMKESMCGGDSVVELHFFCALRWRNGV